MRTVLKCLSVGILLLFFSCKNEEALPLLNPESEMCEIRFSGSAFDFQWNGKALGVKDAWAYPVVEFDAIESDTTKLQLTISSLLPDDIKLAVDVVPGVSEIVFPESIPESLMIWRWKGISCHRKRRKNCPSPAGIR